VAFPSGGRRRAQSLCFVVIEIRAPEVQFLAGHEITEAIDRHEAPDHHIVWQFQLSNVWR
jgi:hypothetical protein